MLIKPYTNEYAMYLKDESRKIGMADSISFPLSCEEAAETVKFCYDKNIPITIQGSRTGVGAGAVPMGGHIMNLERLRKIRMSDDGQSVIAEAGCTLNEIGSFVRTQTKDKKFLPPDPTEGTASAGGMVSCNSSGARTYGYGAIRSYVKALKIILSSGRIIDIKRGENYAVNGSFVITLLEKGNTFISPDSELLNQIDIGSDEPVPISKEKLIIQDKLPTYKMPEVKNAAGYYIKPDMDIIDLFIGAEGTLGTIAEVEFRLEDKPNLIWGVIAFFRESGQGVEFSRRLKKLKTVTSNIISIEFFDEGSLELLRERKRRNPEMVEIHEIPEDFKEGIFTEIKGESLDEIVEALRLIEASICESGGKSEDAWVAGSRSSFESFKKLRHLTPESVNEKISEIKKTCPEITKLGSDMSVSDEDFPEILKMYKNDLEANGLQYVMFGHIGNNHLHVNIISHSQQEYELGKSLFLKWADIIGRKNGSISAEHGVGKLKRDFIIKMYGEKYIDEMRKLKKVFDNKGIFGRDNIFLWK